MDFTLADLYLAFRKAKMEAFHETSQHNAMAFASYEARLNANLRQLLRKLSSKTTPWEEAIELGTFSYLGKAIDPPPESPYRVRDLDPLRDWERMHRDKVAKASFRLVINANVEFQIVSALWIIKVGHKLDSCLDVSVSYGNRLRTIRSRSGRERREINLESLRLFNHYFGDYQAWRNGGLKRMREALKDGREILAITMDLRRYYHSVNPEFILRDSFCEAIGYKPSDEERHFSRGLVKAMQFWYQGTPDARDRPEGALPVGLSASKIIANVLLVEFDRAVKNELQPIYYGRYVDDVFLVLEPKSDFEDHDDVILWMAKRLGPIAVAENGDVRRGGNLTLQLPYASDSVLEFSRDKQKIFHLHSSHGLDLVAHIEEQIRNQSSEHRRLPQLPKTDVEMASRALLATPDATLQADALRKADVVAVRRSGLALLLRDAEFYAKNMYPRQWKATRDAFYGLLERHVLAPRGLFELGSYLTRAFGLMVASNDIADALRLWGRLVEVADLLRKTTTSGTSESEKFDLYFKHMARGLHQAAYQASTERYFRIDKEFVKLTTLLARAAAMATPSSTFEATRRSKLLLHTDWGRRPYKDYWYFSLREDAAAAQVPRDRAVQRVLRLGGIRRFRQIARLSRPHWTALAFPTRALTIPEISLIAPEVMTEPLRFRRAIMALRGARVVRFRDGRFADPPNSNDSSRSRGGRDGKIRVAVTSLLTTEKQWEKAATRKPDRTLARFERFVTLLNAILAQKSQPQYVVMPELSVPRRWAIGFGPILAANNISLIAGIEYYVAHGKGLKNDCFLSLATHWPGYPASVLFMQSKFQPAHEERRRLKALGEKLVTPPLPHKAPIYSHNGLYFSVLICSDLTNIVHRQRVRGSIDALFVLEWNQDVKTFSALVESAASDLHAYVVQVNNRQYGDSRIRAPFREDYRRDVVQVKGGIADYFVVAEVDFELLRTYQSTKLPSATGPFKPTPIGFEISSTRRKP